MNRKKIVIKKYENRRLYDTTNSRYVNLDEVARAVQDGYEVQVVDAASGEDITRLILTQIIVEDAKEPNSPFPLDILRQMVIASGRASQEGALKYMKAMFDVYQNAYRALPQPLTPFDLMQSMMGQGVRPPDAAPAPPPSPVTSAPSSGANAHEDKNVEMSELRRRLEELESQIAQHGAKNTTRPKPKKTSRRKKS